MPQSAWMAHCPVTIFILAMDRVQTAGSFSWREVGGVTQSEIVFIAKLLAAVHPSSWKSNYHSQEY
ncbi:hypothetical protein Pyn_01547 [Prunus yedoensis var. nudiflora]|uniref:Uncharacterized protein n=1 Tax=Prunus yedoensis var. nudiflora TaxID=2094558 RepID=A0A314Z1A1_PRUYE|nr:hypothetical protein Pyn_01547 [Prunus yedoensis var. nudiflora]